MASNLSSATVLARSNAGGRRLETKPLALVVDDEADIARLLELALNLAGIDTACANSGLAALEMAREKVPQLVLLDWGLPDLEGSEVCIQLKRDPRTRAIPVIFVTARASEADRVRAFEAGGDDYVIKPFSVRELTLRCEAMLRKSRVALAPSRLRWGPIELEVDRASCRVHGEPVALTALELRLLAELLAHGDRLRSHENLLGCGWTALDPAAAGPQRLRINRLRKKLERLRDKLKRAGPWLQTVRGCGYRLAPALGHGDRRGKLAAR